MSKNCNLECVEDTGGDDIVEFVGPVKIILVDQPKSAYRNKICNAAFILLAQILIGSTTLLVLYFSTTYRRKEWLQGLHIFLCTVGLQLNMPFAILSVNNLNGATNFMKLSDRKFEHLFLQTVGLICTSSGTVASVFSNYTSLYTIHSFIGFAVNSIAILGALSGIVVYGFYGKVFSSTSLGIVGRSIHCIHRTIGALTFTASSACFISGLLKIPFQKWLPLIDILYFCIAFCIFYTFVILYTPLKHLFS